MLYFCYLIDLYFHYNQFLFDCIILTKAQVINQQMLNQRLMHHIITKRAFCSINKSTLSPLNSYYGFSTKKTVFLFGGQGNQQKGMLDKFTHNPHTLNLIKTQSTALGIDLLQLTTTDPHNLLHTTSHTQPLLLLSQYLQFHHNPQKPINLSNRTIENTYCIGHSLGEYTALVVSGSIGLEECMKLVYRRGELMIKTSEGQERLGTLIVKFREDKFGRILEKVKELDLQVSCYNSPTNIVISGVMDDLNLLKTYMKGQLRIASKVLPAATAFHSRYLYPMKSPFHQSLQQIDFKPPCFQILRNLDCQIYTQKQSMVQGLTEQNTNPVLFRQSVERLVEREGREGLEFVEIGHKEYLKRWVEEVMVGKGEG